MGHYVVAAPPPALRPCVLRLGDACDDSGERCVRRELPQPYVSLLLGVGAPVRVAATGERQAAFVAAVDDHATVADESDWDGVQVDLTPLGARRLFGTPLSELSNRMVPVAALDREVPLVLEALAGCASSPERFAVVERWLGRRAERSAADPVRPDVARAHALLVRSGGRLSVDAVAHELGCSRRHLSRHFRDEVGLPPKAFARVLRFRSALALAESGVSWGAVAASAGFADQSHLVRETRALSGLAPEALLAERRGMPFPDVQDGADAAA